MFRVMLVPFKDSNEAQTRRLCSAERGCRNSRPWQTKDANWVKIKIIKKKAVEREKKKTQKCQVHDKRSVGTNRNSTQSTWRQTVHPLAPLWNPLVPKWQI